MSRPIAVLRPEPGNRATAAAIEARGRTAIRLPLFDVVPLAWKVPNTAGFDALFLTSANAVRHGGPGLATLASLPVYAVGAATADAAHRAGLNLAWVGSDGAVTLIAQAEEAGVRRALHLAGRERTIHAGGIVAAVIPVYASDALPIAPEALTRLAGSIALVQSSRAAARLADLLPSSDRASITLVAVSARAAAAAGPGWDRVVVASEVASDALIDAAVALAD